MIFKILWVIIMGWCILSILLSTLGLLSNDNVNKRMDAFFTILGKVILVWYLILSR